MTNDESRQYQKVPLNRIDPPALEDRITIDPEKVRELAENIDAIGLLQPLVIRPINERFEIVAGHRRYLAVKSLKWVDVMCNVKEMSDVDCALARACENIDREDLTPIEEAYIYQRLVDNFSLTIDQVANRMKKSPGVVKRRMDLLKMPDNLQKAVHLRQITYGVAEEFARLHDVGRIDYYLGYAIDHGITVAVARSWVNEEKRAERMKQRDVGGTLGTSSPLESPPVYISCDTCHGPVQVGQEKFLKICPDCAKIMRQALQGSGAS